MSLCSRCFYPSCQAILCIIYLISVNEALYLKLSGINQLEYPESHTLKVRIVVSYQKRYQENRTFRTGLTNNLMIDFNSTIYYLKTTTGKTPQFGFFQGCRLRRIRLEYEVAVKSNGSPDIAFKGLNLKHSLTDCLNRPPGFKIKTSWR